MKKIALIIDIKYDAGGGLGMCLTKINYIKKLNLQKILIVTTYKSTFDYLKKKYNINSLFYKKNLLIPRLINFLSKKIPFLTSDFQRFLIKKGVEKIFFLSPSYLNILIKKMNYIYTVWDLSHLEKKLEELPEHESSVRKTRDNSYSSAAKYAKFIVIGTKENKLKFEENYKLNDNNIIVSKFPPYICSINTENRNISSISENYLLYPAQYWEHKNHKYLIKFFEDYQFDKYIKNISLVCTGFDKGNHNYLKNLIKEKNLQNRITLLNYIEDEQLRFMYKNSIGIVFPSLIGSHSFPLYEAFYFRKPVFYNKDILSREFSEFVNLIDINSTKSFYDQLIKSFNKNKTKELTDRAEIKFQEIFNEKKILMNLETMIREV